MATGTQAPAQQDTGSSAALSYAQLKGVWLQAAKGTRYATNAWASLMAAIAEAESAGVPDVTNPNDDNGKQTSWGLWQISNGTHDAPASDWADPVANARLAISKLDDPQQGLKAWGTYDSGAYRAYLSDKTTADTAAIPGPSAAEQANLTQQVQQSSDCIWGINPISLPLIHTQIWGGACVLSKSQARAVIGTVLLGVGGLVLLIAAGMAGARSDKTQQVAGAAAKIAGVPGRLRGAP